MKTLAQKHRQKDLRIRTICRRGELARSSPPAGSPDPDFFQKLREFDPGIELIWHPLAKRWVLYRVRRMGCSSDDMMVHEATVRTPGGNFKPPGYWLIDQLKEWDKTKRGAIDPKQADRQYSKKIEKDEDDRIAANEKQLDEICDNAARDMFSVARNPCSVLKNSDL